MNSQEMKEFLDAKAYQYNQFSFVEHDPIKIPHQFSRKEDIEITAFLTAIISWGNRKSIINSATKMLELMDREPYTFVRDFTEADLEPIRNRAIHRTFNGEDFTFFLKSLQHLYREQNSLEPYFSLKAGETSFYHALERFRTEFLKADLLHRSRKHVSSTYKNSSAKRLMMFLRWMVRKDKRGVDFGLWQNTDQKYLSVPLDVHTGNVARKLELVSRKQNDWKTVAELDAKIRTFDADDPAKYDFALFGIGVSGEL